MDKKEKAKIVNSNSQTPVRKRRNQNAKEGVVIPGTNTVIKINTKPEAKDAARTKKRKKRKKTSSFTYFLRAYAGLWLVLTFILCVVLWNNLSKYQKDYDAAKEAGSPELAMQENLDLFTASNIGMLIDEQQPEILSRFETIKDYKAFYKSFLEQKKVGFEKNEELYNDARPVFNVYAYDETDEDMADGELLAIVSFKAAGEKDSFGFNKWDVKDIAISQNIYDYHDVYVKVMDDMSVYINGIEADEREYITGGVIDNAVSDMAYNLTGVTFNYKVYYAGEMVGQPTVQVIDGDGIDVTDKYVLEDNDLKNYESTASDDFIAGVQDRVKNFCETYVYHIYRKASVDAVSSMMESGSEAERLLYNAQSTLAWAWVPDTVEILDESYDEFMYYNENYFSCKSTINIRKSDAKTTEDEEFVCQWLFKKVDGQWLVTYFVLG